MSYGDRFQQFQSSPFDDKSRSAGSDTRDPKIPKIIDQSSGRYWLRESKTATDRPTTPMTPRSPFQTISDRDGSIQTVRCGLEYITDENGTAVENPIQNLTWNDHRFVLAKPPEDALETDTITSSAVSESPETIFPGRECWCARLLISEDASWEGPPPPLFCPLDRNGDGHWTKKDVRICEARIVTSIAANGTVSATIGAECHAENALMEFSKNAWSLAWPICILWWMALVCLLKITHKGMAARGCVWRTTRLRKQALARALKNCQRALAGQGTARGDEEEARGAPNSEENGHRPSEDDSPEGLESSTSPQDSLNALEEGSLPLAAAATELGPEPSLSVYPPLAPSEESLARVEREFGSYENYELLYRSFRHHTRWQWTQYQFETALWRSAVAFRYRNGSTPNQAELEFYRWRPLARHWEAFWRHEPRLEEPGETEEEGAPKVDDRRLCLKTKRFSSMSFRTEREESSSSETLSYSEGESSSPGSQEITLPEDQSHGDLEDSAKDIVRMSLEETFASDDSKRGGNLSLDRESVESTTDADDAASCLGDHTCSICLSELNEGDWMADISCGHVFHKQCLKEWLVKHNHCPVCRMPNIASHPPVCEAVSRDTSSPGIGTHPAAATAN